MSTFEEYLSFAFGLTVVLTVVCALAAVAFFPVVLAAIYTAWWLVVLPVSLSVAVVTGVALKDFADQLSNNRRD